MRGVPGWTATLLALACCLTGIAVTAASGELGTPFTVAYFVGCLAAVLVVARRSVFAAGVQPPILLVVLVPIVYMVAGTGGKTGFFNRSQIISAALPLIERFPLMVATTVVVVVIALVRAFVLEPRPHRRRDRRATERRTPERRPAERRAPERRPAAERRTPERRATDEAPERSTDPRSGERRRTVGEDVTRRADTERRRDAPEGRATSTGTATPRRGEDTRRRHRRD